MTEHNDGHRDRLRARFIENPNSTPDYEKIEVLLYGVLPRLDVKPAAKRLIDKFGTFMGVLDADPDELLKIKGVGNAVIAQIKLFNIARRLGYVNKMNMTPSYDNKDNINNFLLQRLNGEKREVFVVIYLDSFWKRISDEEHSKGNAKECSVYNNLILAEALKLGSSNVIIAHNHPHGMLQFSETDKDETIKLQSVLNKNNIRLYDHLLVGQGVVLSMKESGLLVFK
ncbi:MAG: DNA repair protein RadC [Alphaproteobacteria bacterium]|nr:DNA repair protein RadC [Alphaproteobacteria bacterium]